MSNTRIEKDSLGTLEVPADVLYGINTRRAIDNFPLENRKVNCELIKSYGLVKLACAQANEYVSAWDDSKKVSAIKQACEELSQGKLDKYIVVDSMQGGAGTSTNMNVNEVIANRALQICGRELGDYDYISPNDDINLHQSTNDTYPTALRLAAINRLRVLEESLSKLVEVFQHKEKEFSDVLKIARTEMQDAVLITLGREMSAYASAFGRDRWRICKCEERLRQINLGGTAIGTGLSAPRDYIFRVSDNLRALTGVGFARSEDMVENTQNCDAFVEVSGLLKACASSLYKCASDLRYLASIREVELPARQAGSSIMPDKVNPVIAEAVMQSAMRVFGYDAQITQAASNGNLELNAFMPLIADSLLNSIDLLINTSDMFCSKCIEGIKANEEICQSNVEGSTAIATALLPALGYTKAAEVAQIARFTNRTVREVAVKEEYIKEEEFNELVSPEAILRLGMPKKKGSK